jgi:hypothetical protein
LGIVGKIEDVSTKFVFLFLSQSKEDSKVCRISQHYGNRGAMDFQKHQDTLDFNATFNQGIKNLQASWVHSKSM